MKVRSAAAAGTQITNEGEMRHSVDVQRTAAIAKQMHAVLKRKTGIGARAHACSLIVLRNTCHAQAG